MNAGLFVSTRTCVCACMRRCVCVFACVAQAVDARALSHITSTAVRDAMRNLMLDAPPNAAARCDGRRFDELRSISAEVGVLAGAHGCVRA